jgi:hypothetical protein
MIIPIILISAVTNLWPNFATLWLNICYLVGFIWYFWIMFINLRRHSIVQFQRQSETKAFWKRNQDQIILMVISAIIGGFITWTWPKLQNQFFPQGSAIQPKK